MGIKTTLPKGTELTFNGLEVILDENVHFTIKNAESMDQAAEFVHIHKLPCDMSHFDEGNNVDVTYDLLEAKRIETPKEAVAEEEKAKAKK